MGRSAHLATLLAGLLLLLAALGRLRVADACDICGRECMGSCGDTRTFVTCCYNYLRKRGGVEALAGAPLGLALPPPPPPRALRPRPRTAASALHLRPPAPPAVALYDD